MPRVSAIAEPPVRVYRRDVNAPTPPPGRHPPAIEDFVGRARARHPEIVPADVVVRKYGDSESMSKRIISVILSGAKTGGFSPLLRYERTGAALPRVGQCVLVTQFDGAPALLYRLTEVEIVPFDEVVERHTEIEALELRPLDAWRKFHWVFWTREFEQYGVPLTEQAKIVFQRFELLYPEAGVGA